MAHLTWQYRLKCQLTASFVTGINIKVKTVKQIGCFVNPFSITNIPLDLIQILNNAYFITVLTGAGVSAESGVPTFREAQTGLWARFSPEELATPQAFRENPRLVWDWYKWRREIISKANPNPGHFALVDLETRIRENGGQWSLITQNVDGMHHRAGSNNITELHGNIFREKCFECNKPSTMALSDETTQGFQHCSYCDGLLRPDVVWFGESVPETAMKRAWHDAENCDIFFSIGTSALVQPAASLSMIAKRNDALLVEINMDNTPLTPIVDYQLQGPAGLVLQVIIELLEW